MTYSFSKSCSKSVLIIVCDRHWSSTNDRRDLAEILMQTKTQACKPAQLMDIVAALCSLH